MSTHTSSTLVAESQPSPMKGLIGPCLRSAVFLALLTGLAYPLLTTGLSQLLLPDQANGSLLKQGQTTIGSALIGQSFTGARYFHPRPSATTGADPNEPDKTVPLAYNAGASAGSNHGPTNQALIESVTQRAIEYRALNGVAPSALVPVDAVTASGSGLDPHISIANARAQSARVAKARGLTPEQVQQVVDAHIEARVLGVLGEPRINVLRLNRALDSTASASQAQGAQ